MTDGDLSDDDVRGVFPDPREASPEGIVCAGGRPLPALLKEAYPRGIFPWPHRGYPLLWFSPDPRFVLQPQRCHLHRSLKKTLKKNPYAIKADTAFVDVMKACGASPRPGQRGTWITADMVRGYSALHAEGLAHSIEAWDGDTLVGGLYGVSFGGTYFGESMFARAPDASKVCFAVLCANLVRWGFDLVDCQSYTDHLARFGATQWPRETFLQTLAESVQRPTRPGPWTLELGCAAAAAMLTAELPGELPDELPGEQPTTGAAATATKPAPEASKAARARSPKPPQDP